MRPFSFLQPGRELWYSYGGHWGLYGRFGVFLGGYQGPTGVIWTPHPPPGTILGLFEEFWGRYGGDSLPTNIYHASHPLP